MKVLKLTSKQALKKRVFITIFGMVASLASLVTVTLAWFQMNRKLQTNYSGVAINDLYNVTIVLRQDGELVTDGVIHFEDFFPGDVNAHSLEIDITNNGDDQLNTSWFFVAPTAAQEVPYVDSTGQYGPENYYYYFGSQIQIFEVSAVSGATSVDTGVGEGEYLVETSSVGVSKGQVNGVATVVNNIPRLEIINAFPIESGATANIVFSFVFTDNGTNQNVYSLGWPSVGVCQRSLGVFVG